MNKSENISELAKALNIFQGKLKAVKKDGVNPFFKTHYATLDAIWEAIREPLSTNGLAITQTLGQSSDGKALLDTTLLHTSGEWLSGSMLLNPVKEDPQGLGSAISYARRYSLCAMLGIVADEDDDANIATKPKSVAKSTADRIDKDPEVAEQSAMIDTKPTEIPTFKNLGDLLMWAYNLRPKIKSTDLKARLPASPTLEQLQKLAEEILKGG